MGDEEKQPVQIDETRSLATDEEGKAVEGEPAEEGAPEAEQPAEAEPEPEQE